MADRRGLGQAMGMSSEKLAFIAGRPTPTAAAEPSSASVIPVPEADVAQIEPADETNERVETDHSTTRPKRPARSRETASSRARDIEVTAEPAGLYGPIKVPLTIRLNPQTADALRRACLEQKLARRTPNSQQEIAEIAISGWLREQGHL